MVFAPETTTASLDGIFNNMNSNINNVSNQMQISMDQVNQQLESGEFINPATLLQFQFQMENFVAFIDTCSSIIKQFGDMDKTVAQNIGV